jgi:citrate synthase
VAALATLSGPLHGTAADAVLDALDADDPAAALRDRAGDSPIPGFGHPLYDRIDPRCRPARRRAPGGRVAPGLDRIDSPCGRSGAAADRHRTSTSAWRRSSGWPGCDPARRR